MNVRIVLEVPSKESNLALSEKSNLLNWSKNESFKTLILRKQKGIPLINNQLYAILLEVRSV